MGVFFNSVAIKGDVAHGTRVYLDGEELKQCVSARLEIKSGAPPVLTVSMMVDQVDVGITEPAGVVFDG